MLKCYFYISKDSKSSIWKESVGINDPGMAVDADEQPVRPARVQPARVQPATPHCFSDVVHMTSVQDRANDHPASVSSGTYQLDANCRQCGGISSRRKQISVSSMSSNQSRGGQLSGHPKTVEGLCH